MKNKNIGKDLNEKLKNQTHIRDLDENIRKDLGIYEDAEIKQPLHVHSKRARDEIAVEVRMDFMQAI